MPDPLNPFARSEVTFNDASFRNADNTYKASITVYAELRAASAALRDYTIELSYGAATDRAKATGIWSERTRFRGTGETGTIVVPGMNGVPNAAEDRADVKRYLKAFKSATVDNLEGQEARDGTLGTSSDPKVYTTNDDKTLVLTPNPVEFEFKISPTGVEKMSRVRFDTSRSAEEKGEYKVGGNWLAGTSTTLPLNPDKANDDPVESNEITIPLNGKLYSFDAPGIVTSVNDFANPQLQSQYSHFNGYEFVRAMISVNPAFVHPSVGIQGSRSSEYSIWHSWVTRTREADGGFPRPADADGKIDKSFNDVDLGRKTPL